MREVLLRDGHEVDTVGDARAAIRAVRATPPDLVLLDMVLPDMDGLQLLRIIKARPEQDFVPVILLSVDAGVDACVKGLRGGADDFLAKPYADAEVQARAAAMLRIKKLQDTLRAKKAELEQLAVMDGVTGLYNRRYFQQRLSEEFGRALRYKDPFALMMFDVDHFKQVNDTYGHPFGDRVLEGTARLIRSCTRNVDICCRCGGDEFAIILPRTSQEGARTVADRFLRKMRESVHAVEGRTDARTAQVRVTASTGISVFSPDHASTPETLVRLADQALYRSKREGRDRVTVHTPPGETPPPAA
jgi:diguanylate cyclase (GGDEF)-like protein